MLLDPVSSGAWDFDKDSAGLVDAGKVAPAAPAGASRWDGFLSGLSHHGLVGGIVGLIHPSSFSKHLPGFAGGGDLTPLVGKRVRLGERGPELVVDERGGVQPVGLHGPESGVPLRSSYVIPHEDLSDTGKALVAHSRGSGPLASLLGGQQSDGRVKAVTDELKGVMSDAVNVARADPRLAELMRQIRQLAMRATMLMSKEAADA
jgi:hypothetical protein